MSEVILDTLIDSIKLVPFLFLTYLAMEYLEHKAGEKTTHMVRKAGKMGPLIGGVAGVWFLGSSIQLICRQGDHSGNTDSHLSVHF